MRLTYILPLILATSCYLKQYPLNPRVAGEATYRVQDGEVSATAWAVDPHHMVTAGHFCDHSQNHAIVAENFTKHIPVKAEAWELSEYNGRYDLCVLKSEVELKHPLILARDMPKVGQEIGLVAYPLNQYTISTGVYLGDLDPGTGEDNTWNDADFNAYCNHGSSGAAIYTTEGVVGVDVRFRTDEGYVHDGTDGCSMVTLSDLRSFLDEHSVSYDLTPDLPTEPNDPLPMEQ